MTKAFDSIKQGLLEAIAHASGQQSTAIVHLPQPIDVKAIRKQVGMTQMEFAVAFGISVSTLRHWERGGSNAPGASAGVVTGRCYSPPRRAQCFSNHGGQ